MSEPLDTLRGIVGQKWMPYHDLSRDEVDAIRWAISRIEPDRTPGPATTDVVEAVRQHRPYLDSRHEVVVVIPAAVAGAFIAEHEPAKPGGGGA